MCSQACCNLFPGECSPNTNVFASFSFDLFLRLKSCSEMQRTDVTQYCCPLSRALVFCTVESYSILECFSSLNGKFATKLVYHPTSEGSAKIQLLYAALGCRVSSIGWEFVAIAVIECVEVGRLPAKKSRAKRPVRPFSVVLERLHVSQ